MCSERPQDELRGYCRSGLPRAWMPRAVSTIVIYNAIGWAIYTIRSDLWAERCAKKHDWRVPRPAGAVEHG